MSLVRCLVAMSLRWSRNHDEADESASRSSRVARSAEYSLSRLAVTA